MPLKSCCLAETLFLLLFCCCFSRITAQKTGNGYLSEWKKAEALQQKGFTRSSLHQVEQIYRSAKKNHDEVQVIKALLFKINLGRNIEEDASIKAIGSAENEIQTAKGAAKGILQSIAAQLYLEYFRQNRYRIYQRTNTSGFEKKSIATWTSDDFNKKITGLFVASLEDEALLRQTNLAPYDAVILKGNARYLRPTLYDLLAHRALEYFKTDEPDISKPAYSFEIKDPMAFAPAAWFIHRQFITKDTSSLHQKALVIFQKLLAFHLHDSKKDALIDADMERISFINQYAVMQHKNDLYLTALRNLAEKYPANPASAQALFLVAESIYSGAMESGRQNVDSPRFRIAESKRILDSLVQKFPESEGGINAQNLLKTILHPSMNVTTEKVNIPGQPFRTLVTYQNFHTIYFRIIPLSPELKKSLQQDGDNDRVFTRLTSEKSIRSWKQDLPERDDYLSHSVEVKIDALPVGEYALISSAGAGFSLVKNPLAAQYFAVSGISFVNRGLRYFVLDRTTGHPLGGATVQVWDHQYSYSSRSDSLIKKETYTTDNNGFFKMQPPLKKEENRNILLDITYRKDHLFLDDNQYVYYNLYNQDRDAAPQNNDQQDFDKDHATLFLFTDRSIYRPGQTVYFKGIGVTKDRDTKKSVLLQSKDSLTMVLSGANGRRTDSIKVGLNDFGSFSGRFTIPAGQLNGEFSVEAEAYDHSSVSFSVEEYKRPRFFTEFETVKETFRIGDTVSITGFAKAYAGNDIDAASVTYRVTRIPRFLYPWIFWKIRMPVAKPLEITHGEMSTGVNGRFVIRFAAIPDESLDPQTDPVFDYKVEAEVTDINGETRDATITVPVGYKALNLQINLPQGDIIEKDSLRDMVISSKNLSGEPETVTADVKIYQLQPPGRLIRERLWEEPDQFIYNKNDYLRYFPHDEYKNETKKETWQRGQMIYEKRDSVTPGHSVFSMDASLFHQGYYVAVATAEDRFGQEVKDIRYFQVYEPQSAGLPAPAYLWDHVEKDTLQPGQTAHIITGTSAKDLFIIQDEDRGVPGGSEEFLRYSLSNGKKTFSFPVSEKDRGVFRVNRFFVKDNRFYAVSDKIGVPWSNKELRISFDTYRDKTLPGSKEKWKVTIKGNKGQKVAAEMLADMYDESLDQFRPHSWRMPDVWPVNDSYDPWRAGLNFTAVHSLEKSVNERYLPQKEKTYDALNYLPQYHLLLGYRTDVRMAAPGLMKEQEMVLPTDTTTSSRFGNKIPALMDQSPVQVRKNFNETAFFFPALRTDEEGNIEFSFTMPEALTQWKLMLLAHTRELETGYAEKTVITQKDLMVQPNAPRFLREGDQLEFSAKIVNLSGKELRGTAGFHLFHASSMMPADSLFKNLSAPQSFTVAAGQSTVVTFSCKVPENYEDAVTYRIVAQAGSFSDGEEAAIPVVSNRVLVTETQPLPMQGDGTKGFIFEKLRNEKKSPTLANYGLTVEYTTNPAWYALQSLPYLMEYPDECTEQTFNRYYAGSMATKIIQSSPQIKAVFEKWTTDTTALQGNLQKNEDLKSVLLQETPWLLQAHNEAQQMEHLATLLDSTKMSLQLQSALERLKESQSPNGGFVWFKGGPDDRYITQYILTGIGHLQRLEALPATQQKQLQSIADKALPYADRLLKEDYEQLLESKTDLKKDHLSPVQIQYLYMHSFFPKIPVAKETQAARTYYLQQARKYWLRENKYLQGMIAVFLYRTNEAAMAKEIIRSLKENAVDNQETGMYWKEWDHPGYSWFQAPVEAQSLMIEAFSEVENDPATIANLKTWLLKNKQTNHWETTRATADACYALLLHDTGLLSPQKTVTLQLGPLTLKNSDVRKVAATGYFKYRINAGSIKPEMGNITVTVSSNSSPAAEERNQAAPSWGAVYWQYFENLDQVTFSETPLKASKKLFVEENTAKGPVLIPVNDGDTLHPGDKIQVRITLQADRDLEYVDMKDMRASCMEPAHVISGYKYQDGLGYYETSKDVSTHFYFDHLYRGTYVFEYPLFVTHAGNFSNGITTVQCMYAPEFTAHSEGVRVNVSIKK